MSGAPDLTEALVGFRAWRVDGHGFLAPWSLHGAGAWVPGTNVAACHMHRFDPSRAGARHRPPAAHCMCGIYALARFGDRRLHGHGDQAIGAIAAWGDVELHRTGFRAEQAAVVALAFPPRGGPPRAHLEAAAARYGVELVPRRRLAAAAARFGAPLDPSLLLEPGAAADDGPPPSDRRLGETGIALDEHVWARAATAHVDTGPTDALRELLGPAPDITTPPVGTRVAAGDVLAVATGADGRALLVWCPVTGTLAEVDPAMPGGRLARVLDTDWQADQARLTFGRRGETYYAAELARARGGHDVFAEVLCEQRLHAPPVRSAADVLRELERRRTAPEHATAAELQAACAEAVHERVAADPEGAARAGRAGVALRVLAPALGAELHLHARGGEVAVRCGASPLPADVTLTAEAPVVARLFAGELDVAQALRSGALASDAPLPRTLGVLSMVKYVL